MQRNVVATLSHERSQAFSEEDIKGRLGMDIGRFKLQVSGQANAEIKSTREESMENASIKLSTDLSPPATMITVNDLRAYITNIPSLLNSTNGGKGKPVFYTLMPVSKVWMILEGGRVEDNFDVFKEDKEDVIMFEVIQMFNEFQKTSSAIASAIKQLSTPSTNSSFLEELDAVSTQFGKYFRGFRNSVPYLPYHHI